MFVSAIEEVSKFTRPIHTLERRFGSNMIRPGAATLFFVNEEGVALTCRHVADSLLFADQVRSRYWDFKEKQKTLHRGGSYNKKITELAKEHGFDNTSTCELHHRLINCADGFKSLEIKTHPAYDLAIVRLLEPVNLQVRAHAVFKKDSAEIKQGAYLCRLGFPFPEFNNFRYNADEDRSEWTNTGIQASPIFPIDGMLTRFLGGQDKIFGIEMSTPGLRGQSGGPLFDKHGIVYGMQFATSHLHLGFDMKQQEVMANGEKIKATNQPFLHVGYCIHVDMIKEFLKEHSVKFYET